MSDPAEDIADALAAHVNGLQETDSPFAFTFTASVPDDIQDELKREHLDLKVFFASYGESVEKRDRGGGALIQPQVSLLVARRVDSAYTRRALNNLVWAIRSAVRKASPAGWTWTADDTVVKGSDVTTSSGNQFVSVSRFTFTGYQRAS